MNPAKRIPESDPVFSMGSLLRGMIRALPLGLAVATYGVVFGILSRQAGLTGTQALFMSAAVFAGASQFVALTIWTWPLPSVTLVVTTFVVNLRHILMGAALKGHLTGLNRWQTFASLFFMADENWAYSLSAWRRGDPDKSLLAGTGLCLFLAWTLSTAAGVFMLKGLDPVTWGMDFAFTAIFIFLATGLFKGKEDLLPWVAAGITAAAAAHFFPGKWYILLGGVAGSMTGALIHER